ncbi:MAG: 30S ribosomal protein S12 methylthiotransferase RimO, partial [Betaproteobacteria bacterium HGW-Betaproteobacteria-17]
AARLATKIGREIEVIVDGQDEVGTLARSHGDAPEIDGVVYLEGVFGLPAGTRLKVQVEEADEHDLWATPV